MDMKVSDVNTNVLVKWLKDYNLNKYDISNLSFQFHSIEIYNIEIVKQYVNLEFTCVGIKFNTYTLSELGPFCISIKDYNLYLREEKINNLLGEYDG